jgi:uncharacterized peroxidase-related enzyme
MSVRVPLVAETDATGDLAAIYDDIKGSLNIPFVPDMFRLLSTRPDLLKAILGGYQAIFLGGVLDRRLKETIAAWTARLNQCPYCVGTHNFFVLAFGGTPELTNAIETAAGVEDLPLDDKTKSLLAFTEKITLTPWKITDGDWASTRDAGWSESEVLEASFTAALFGSITRMVDGLGLGSSVEHSRISQLPQSENA